MDARDLLWVGAGAALIPTALCRPALLCGVHGLGPLCPGPGGLPCLLGPPMSRGWLTAGGREVLGATAEQQGLCRRERWFSSREFQGLLVRPRWSMQSISMDRQVLTQLGTPQPARLSWERPAGPALSGVCGGECHVGQAQAEVRERGQVSLG